MADANARPPKAEGDIIGSHGSHRASPTTPLLLDFVKECGVWLPASFDNYVHDQSLPGTYFYS
eukprot:7393218-Karenia_brevis.AAC.1